MYFTKCYSTSSHHWLVKILKHREIADSLRLIRDELGISQEALARELGVSFSTVNRWETGAVVPRAASIGKIRQLLGAKANSPIQELVVPDRPRPVAYSLFSGGGGFHLGMERAGFDVVLASDINVRAQSTHKKNWPSLPFLAKDVRQVHAEELFELAGGRKPEVIFGGPPCQGFSTLGAKISADPRNLLFDAFVRLVDELQPKVVVMENVKSMLTMYGGRYADFAVRRFYEVGYRVYRKVLDAASFGVPQHRQRVFFVATRLDHKFAFPCPTHGLHPTLNPFATVGQRIMDLVGKEGSLNGHIPLAHSDRVVRRYQLIPEGGRLPPPEELPEEIRRKNFGNTYKRLDRSRPSLTIVPGNNALPVHPTLDRSLTPREAARLQTFPDSFEFTGDRRQQCILVGNAVPPILAEHIGRAIRDHMAGRISEERSDEHCFAIVEPAHCRSSEIQSALPLEPTGEREIADGFVDLFCGAGGFTIGFTRAGWRPLLGADFNHFVAKSHHRNFPEIPFLEADLSEPEARELLIERFSGAAPGILVGGPPCQGFSIFGKRRFVNTTGYDPHKDPRNRLVFAFLDLAARLRPRWVILENVPGFANLDEGYFLRSVLQDLAKMGYSNAEARILNAAHYGVPQLRRRLVIIANRTGHVIPWPKQKFFEVPKEWQSPYRTVGEVISDLATVESLSRFSCHVPMKHKPLLVERYQHIPEGGKLDVSSLPDHLKKGYRTEKVKNYSHVFKRLHRDRPSITMVPGHNAFPIHPWLDRALTVREAARIQTFPDDVEFIGPRQEQCIQAGNAFPPLLAELIANNIRKAEANAWRPGQVPPSAYYALVERPENCELIGQGADTKMEAVG